MDVYLAVIIVDVSAFHPWDNCQPYVIPAHAMAQGKKWK